LFLLLKKLITGLLSPCADWKKATQNDPDLLLILMILQHHAEIPKQQLINKSYHLTFSRNQFEYEDGILYYYEEPRKA
jgi:hypothetical protein